MRSKKLILIDNNIFLLVLALSMSMMACKKDTTNSSYIAKAVVQGYLVAGQPVSVYLKKEILIGSTDTTTQTIDGLVVKVLSSGNTIVLNPKGHGIYQSDSTYKVVAGQTYNLDFIYNGTEITSSTIIPAKPTGVTISDTTLAIPPNTHDFSSVTGSLTLNWNNTDNAYFLVVVQSFDTLSPIDTSSFRRRFFRNQPVQSNTDDISAREFSYYGRHYVILYKLNPDYAALYNGSQNNSQNLTKPISNINNGLGIFSGMNTDTLIISITEN